MASTADIAQALKYGPRAGQQMRRSAYLEDALRALAAPSQNISSPGELAARLAGVAILNRASNRAQDRVLQAIADDRKAETARLLAGLAPKAPVAPPVPELPVAQQPVPQSPMVAAPPPMPQLASTSAPPQSPGGQGAYREAIAGIESRGSGDYGALGPTTKTGDRAYGRYQIMGANLPEWTREALGREMTPEQFLADPKAQDAVFDHRFGSFVEQYGSPQEAASVWFTGRPMQQGADRRDQLGTSGFEYVQRFSQGLGPQAGPETPQPPQSPMQPLPAPNPQMAEAPMQPPQAPEGDMQPFQVATAGALQPEMIPSAPASSPPPSGAPPAATPQAAAGGNAPQWPNYMPTDSERERVAQLLNDPRTFEEGRAEAMKLQQKMSQPAPAKIVEMNGVQFYVPETPGQGGPPLMIPVPQQAMTRNAPAEQFGIAAQRGTIMAADPYNNLKVIVQPEAGQQVASNPGQPYSETFVPGGKNDPYRVQAPAQNYQYQGGRQTYIPGSAADPASGANLVAGEGKLRDDYQRDIKEYTAAREGYGKVVAAAKTATPAGDIALIFGLMKTLDPTSTVREGEYATVSNSGTVDQTVQNAYNRLLTGEGSLTPQQRAQYADTARRQFEVYQRTADGLTQRYSELAQSYGYKPERIVRQFAPIEPFDLNAGKPSQPSAVQIKKLQSIKGYDRSKPLGDPAHPFVAVDDATVQRLDKPENRGKHIVLPNGAIAVIE